MIKKIDFLSQYGFSPEQVMSIVWRNLTKKEKERLSFVDLLLFLSVSSSMTSKEERAHAFKLIKSKCEDFDNCLLVYQRIERGTNEKEEILKLAEAKAKGFDDFLWVYRETVNPIKKDQRYEQLKKKAGKFDDYLDLWRFSPSDFFKKAEAFELLLSEADTYEKCVVISMYTAKGSKSEGLVFDKIKKLSAE